MTKPRRTAPPTTPSRTQKAHRWIAGLTALATLPTVTVLVLTGNAAYVPAVLGVGAAAAAGGAVEVRVTVRR